MRILVAFCIVISVGVAEAQRQNAGRKIGTSHRQIPRGQSVKSKPTVNNPSFNRNVLLPGAFKPVGQFGGIQLGTLGTLRSLDINEEASSTSTDSFDFLGLLPKIKDLMNGLDLDDSFKPLQPVEMIQGFFPMIREVMKTLAASENRSLTTAEESNLNLTETVMTMSVGIMGDLISSSTAVDVKKSVFSLLNMSRPIMEAYAKKEERPMTQEESVFLYYFENSFKFTVDIMEEFAKVRTPEGFVKASSEVAKFFLSSRANAEGRQISTGETDLIKNIENEVITNINIMRGFSNYTNTDTLIDTTMMLVEYIMDHNANRELPKRKNLNFHEKGLLKTIETALREGASLLNDLHDGVLSINKIVQFNKDTRILWEEQAKDQNRTELSVKELEYLDFTDQILATVRLMYKAW